MKATIKNEIWTEELTKVRAAIDPKILERLMRGIDALLNAGRNTEQVVEALKPQASFGKYDGCHPSAIRTLAIARCREANREIAQQNAEMAREINKSLREHFPNFFR